MIVLANYSDSVRACDSQFYAMALCALQVDFVITIMKLVVELASVSCLYANGIVEIIYIPFIVYKDN